MSQTDGRSILLLSRYDRTGASSRIRSLQYLPFLAEQKTSVTVVPFFDAAYLQSLYAGRGRGWSSIGYYSRRLKTLLAAGSFDLVWIEYEAFPWVPWMLERLALPAGIPIVSDYDDAIFHRYDMHGSGLVRALLGRKIERVMAHATLVTAGNGYLADRARTAGARAVEIVPTVVDTQSYRPGAPTGRPPVFGWIGSPSTWQQYVVPMLPLLKETAKACGARLTVVGSGLPEKSGPAAMPQFLDWSESSEVESIQGMDIGLMPLTDDPWSRGKCGYKLIQYMACGLPVVASPVGVNTQIVEHGVNGFLADRDADWRRALQTLAENPELRARMGRAGREKVEREYSLQAYGPRVAAMLRQTAKERTP